MTSTVPTLGSFCIYMLEAYIHQWFPITHTLSVTLGCYIKGKYVSIAVICLPAHLTTT